MGAEPQVVVTGQVSSREPGAVRPEARPASSGAEASQTGGAGSAGRPSRVRSGGERGRQPRGRAARSRGIAGRLLCLPNRPAAHRVIVCMLTVGLRRPTPRGGRDSPAPLAPGDSLALMVPALEAALSVSARFPFQPRWHDRLPFFNQWGISVLWQPLPRGPSKTLCGRITPSTGPWAHGQKGSTPTAAEGPLQPEQTADFREQFRLADLSRH